MSTLHPGRVGGAPADAAAALRAVITLACRAPSVRNSQPWLWIAGPHCVELHADRGRWDPTTDPDRRDLLISCGTALHHLRVALACAGAGGPVHRFPDPARVDHVATVGTAGPPPGEADLAPARALAARRADTRRFSGWAVPADFVEELAGAAAVQGAVLRVVPGPLRAVVDGDAGGGLLLVLATADDGPVARVRAGEAASAVLLRATVLGLASCPLSLPSGRAEARALLREQVLDRTLVAQLLVRVGWATDGRPLPVPPRRPLDEVLVPMPG